VSAQQGGWGRGQENISPWGAGKVHGNRASTYFKKGPCQSASTFLEAVQVCNVAGGRLCSYAVRLSS
jgi:hypothetical protein